MDDYLTIDKGNRDLKPIFCSLTSYEAKGDKRDRSIKKTKATILCGLVHDETSHVAIGEAVRPSTYMIHYENKTIQEIIKLITFYQWGKSSSTYKISGLHIDALELRNQMTATFSFSTSLKAVRDLTIAVLVRSSFMQFGNISYDDDHLEVEPHFEGLAIDVFEAAVAVLPDRFNYKLVPFYGSCDQLVEEVASKTFHAGVGGILITAERSHVVEFSQPYAELGLVKVEKRKTNELNRVLWFMSPFTCEMWLTMAAITVFTGSVIWLIEHKTHCNNEVPSRQVEAVLCLFPFAFLLNEHRPKNILSYYVLVPWLVMTLIVTTTFTARLSSMVTSSQAEPPDNIDINSLKRTAAAIASCGNSLTISSYLVKTLGFKLNNMRIFASVDNCAKALSNGNIKAAFLLTTDAKVFLAKYRRTFVKSGPAYNLGSFGFVFPRGSSLASEMSEAILKVKEAGEVQEMKEYKLPSNSDCSESDETVSQGIGPEPFSALFIFSGDCAGDHQEIKATDDACIMHCIAAGDAYRIELMFNHSHGNVTPIDLDDYYQSYIGIRSLNSRNLPIFCTVTNYEAAFTTEINEVVRRTKATVLCALPAKPESTMGNESSTSYMSRHMYEITRQIAGLIGNYQWLKPGSGIYEKSDDYRVCELNIVTFNMNSHHMQNGREIVQMAATLSFLTTRPLQYYRELTIAVPVRSIPTQFLNISLSQQENHKEAQITGFWIDFFKATMEMMPNTTYKLVPFYGSDDQLVKELSRKTFDAAVGLTIITKERLELVEFFPLFTVGPVIVMKKNIQVNQVLSFLRPFTNEMWLTMAVITIFTAFAIWLVEHRTNISESDRQVGAIFWFSFATLFYGGHRESPRRNLTYFVLAPWLFLILIVTSTYTASFTSMITSSDSEPESSCLDLENLRKTNAIIACDEEEPLITRFLVDAAGFQPKNIKFIAQSSIDDYAKALTNGDIKAAFFLWPYADLFLAKYSCKGFRAWDAMHGLRGSPIMLPRGSPLAPFISEAISSLLQSGKFKQMQKELLSFSGSSSSTIYGSMKRGIGPGPFLGLFILSGGASAIAMLITIVRLMKRRWENFVQRMLMGRGLWVWLTTLLYQNQNQNQRTEIQLSRISSTSPTQVSS
ncbi:Ionotropic glutamate receptor [Corchorus capsularis]|uniref:Ionotropic glutamate receptor n=1 Tax=Corchorus capsularis TaxID=210143 RepID=A0A1R3GF13_COCAP|nr:Ionotropic glutamate receptor [Corchorus capsularis]